MDLRHVEFMPPRAAGGVRSRTAAVRFAAGDWNIRGGAAVGEFLRSFQPRVDRHAVLVLALPGLGHLRNGSRAAGLILLTGWFVLLALAAYHVGTPESWYALGAAVGWHTTSVGFLAARSIRYESVWERLRIGLKSYAALLLLLYGPVLLLGHQFFGVLRLDHIRGIPALANGDVLLVHRRGVFATTWRRGDVVVYAIRERRRGGYTVAPGTGVDRIIGLPGETVATGIGGITVNGQPLPDGLGPLGRQRLPDAVIRAGADEYVIFPSLLPWRGRGVEASDMYPVVAAVREADLHGKVWWRVRPWSRFGAVRINVESEP
jgi:hypothetical protein